MQGYKCKGTARVRASRKTAKNEIKSSGLPSPKVVQGKKPGGYTLIYLFIYFTRTGKNLKRITLM